MVQERSGWNKGIGVWKLPTGTVEEVGILNPILIEYSFYLTPVFLTYRVRIFVMPLLENSKKKQE